MSEWKEYKLGEIAEIKMGQSPESKYYNLIGEGLPFLQGNRTFGLRYPTFDTYCSDPKKIAAEGEILFSVRAPVGDINIATTNICIGRGLASFKSKNGNNKYLFYLLHFIKRDIINAESGTVFGSVNKNDLENIQILVPNKAVQNEIVEVLSSFDDKIDLLHRQNKTLEQLAETLFRQWFVEEAEESWPLKPLGEYVVIKRGGSPRPIHDYISDSGYNWLKISDVTGLNSPFIFEIKEHIKEEGLNKTTFLKKGSLVLSNSATPGIPKILDVDSCVHDGWLHFPKSKFSREFLYLFFKFIKPELLQLGNGSIFTNLKTDILKEYILRIPDDKSLSKFDEQVKTIFEKLYSNTTQIRSLTQLRDTLLPKLMSGEVGVDN